MRLLRPLLSAVLIAVLVGCGPSSGGDSGDTGSGDTGSSDTGSSDTGSSDTGSGDTGSGDTGVPTATTYQVSDLDCPDGWTGLTVATDNDAEVEYLDDMPACTNASGNTTYLRNNNDAVWVLEATSEGLWTPIGSTLVEDSFIAAVRDEYPGRAILMPGAEGTVDLPPEQLEWIINLPLSFGWQAHDLVVERIASAGESLAVAALKRRSQAGAALAVCTLAVTKFANDLAALEDADAALEDADASDVLLSGLGAAASASACRSEAASVPAVDEAGRSITLADDLALLRSQTPVLEKAHIRLNYAQRASKVMFLGLKFLR